MPVVDKSERIAELRDRLSRAKVALVTDHRGLTVAQLGELRAQMRAIQAEVKVAKNTLARRAVREAGHDGVLDPVLEGPTMLIFGYDDISRPSRVLNEYVRTSRLRIDLRGALVEGRFFDGEQARQLTDMPSRETLIAQLLGTLQSPIAQLVGTIQAPIQNLVGLLEAYKNKLEAA